MAGDAEGQRGGRLLAEWQGLGRAEAGADGGVARASSEELATNGEIGGEHAISDGEIGGVGASAATSRGSASAVGRGEGGGCGSQRVRGMSGTASAGRGVRGVLSRLIA